MKTGKMKKEARAAGMYYLIMAITGAFSLMFVHDQINIADNISATITNLHEKETLFRLGIVASLLCQIAFILTVLALYRLLKDVNQKAALIMVVLVVIAVPIAFLNNLNQVAVLMLLSGSDYLSGFNTGQINSLAIFFLELFKQGNYIAGVFWGLWLFPLGYLVFKSGFLPRIIGILLMAACISYLADSMGILLNPQPVKILSTAAMVLGVAGEFSIMLWLLIRGVNTSALKNK